MCCYVRANYTNENNIYLYLKGIHLQKLVAFLHVIHPIFRLTELAQLFDDLRQACIVSLVKAQLPQLCRKKFSKLYTQKK